MIRKSETDQLESELSSLGVSIRRQHLYEGAIKLLGFILIGLVLFYLVDYLAKIPYILRLIILFGGLGYGFYWYALNFIKKYKKNLSAHDVSLIVENSNPELQSRVVSTLEFQSLNNIDPGTSENLVEGMISQTFNLVKNIKWQNVVEKKWVKGAMRILLIGVIIFVVAGAVSKDAFFIFFQRLLLPNAKYPTNTQIIDVQFENVNKGDKVRIPEGEKVILLVKATGIKPKMGKIEMSTDSGSSADYDLVLDENSDLNSATCTYRCVLDAIVEPIEVTVYLGDDRWGPIEIDVIPRPKIKSIQFKIVPPKYTGFKNFVENGGNFQAFDGSKVTYEIISDKPLKSLEYFDYTDTNKKVPLTKVSDTKWKGELSITKNFKYSFLLVDNESLNSIDIPVYSISVQHDKKPSIKIKEPYLNIEVAPVTRVPVHLILRDDISIQNVKIYAQLMGRDEQGEEIDLDEAKLMFEKKSLNKKLIEYNTMAWKMATLKAVPGNQIKIWIEVTDNHEPKPLVSKSPEVIVSIISAEAYKAKLNEEWQRINKGAGEIEKQLEKASTEIINLKK